MIMNADSSRSLKMTRSSLAIVWIMRCLKPLHQDLKKTGGFRRKFLKESLEQLDQELRKLGSGLVLVAGIPEKKLSKLAEAYGAQKIYAEKEAAQKRSLPRKEW